MERQLLTSDLEEEESEKTNGGGRTTVVMGVQRERERERTTRMGGERENDGQERIRALMSEILLS